MKMRIRPDFEKAKAIMKMIRDRRGFVRDCKRKISTTIICENYYEIIKELATALGLCRGIKFVGEHAHKELLEELVNMMGFDKSYLVFLDDLRMRRNGSLYYGERFEDIYLDNNEKKIEFLIKKTEGLLKKELRGVE